MSNDPTAPERTARYKDTMEVQGYRRVAVWVHEDDRESIKQAAEALRERRRENEE